MDHDAITTTVDRFNEDQARFDVGMGYVSAGIGSVQLFVQHVQRGTLEGPRHLPLLVRAAEMLDRGRSKISDNDEVERVVDKYLALIETLTSLVDPPAETKEAPED